MNERNDRYQKLRFRGGTFSLMTVILVFNELRKKLSYRFHIKTLQRKITLAFWVVSQQGLHIHCVTTVGQIKCGCLFNRDRYLEQFLTHVSSLCILFDYCFSSKVHHPLGSICSQPKKKKIFFATWAIYFQFSGISCDFLQSVCQNKLWSRTTRVQFQRQLSFKIGFIF